MKNIIISGCPRSGKTTLSNLIKKEWPFYNVIHCDAIRNVLIKVMDYEQVRKCVHNDLEFSKIVVEYVNDLIRGSSYPFIVEWSRLYPSLLDSIEGDNISVALSLGDISPKGLFEMCRKYDKSEDFTYFKSDEELISHCEHWIRVNERINLEKKYADIFVNSFDNRQFAFECVIDKLRQMGSN